jgi:hypothetical protein
VQVLWIVFGVAALLCEALQPVSTLGPARALGDPRVLQFQQNHLRQFLVGGNFANLDCALVASPGEKLPFVRS